MDLTTTITQKGQVTVPAKYRKELNLRTGTKVSFQYNFDNELTLKPIRDFTSLRGYFTSSKRYSKNKARETYIKDVISKKV